MLKLPLVTLQFTVAGFCCELTRHLTSLGAQEPRDARLKELSLV